MKISAYWKSVVAGLSPVVLAVEAAVDDGAITGQEWVPIAVAVLAALGVWRIPNR